MKNTDTIRKSLGIEKKPHSALLLDFRNLTLAIQDMESVMSVDRTYAESLRSFGFAGDARRLTATMTEREDRLATMRVQRDVIQQEILARMEG